MTALDDQVRETVNRVLESIRDRLESELGTCQDELVRAAQEASRSSAEASANATAEVQREAERQLTESREFSAREMEEQRARFTAEVEELQRLLSEARDETRRIVEEQERRADGAREAADAVTRDLESARQQLDETREDVEATLRDIEAARRDSDAARRELQDLSDVLRRKSENAAQASRLPAAVRGLDESTTFGHVLESLAREAGREAGRAAVFLVKGDRLLDWRTVGFDFASDAPRLDVAFSDSGPMANAVRSGQGVRTRGDEHELPGFARNGEIREAAAWPISVGGSVVAALYADGPVADNPDELYWPAFLDVLAMHAGRVLEGITVRQAAGLMTGRPMGMSPSSSVSRQSSGSIQ